jgi:hypothetical protein
MIFCHKWQEVFRLFASNAICGLLQQQTVSGVRSATQPGLTLKRGWVRFAQPAELAVTRATVSWTSGAIASSGIGKTQLTLISHRT